MTADIVPFRTTAELELLRKYRSMPERERCVFFKALVRMTEGQSAEDAGIEAFVELGEPLDAARRKVRAAVQGKRSD